MNRVAVPLDLSFSAPPRVPTTVLRGPTMGVTWTLKALLPPGLSQARVQDEVQASLNRIVTLMSGWETGSEVSGFNRAVAGTWLPLSLETYEVLDCALALARCGDGAFDPTVGRLVDLWGFGPPGAVARPPAPEVVAEALSASGWVRLQVDKAGRRVLQPGGVHLDFSGIAKGFGVDQAVRTLKTLGVEHFLLEIGGELHGAGVKANGEPWWVEIEAPPGIEQVGGEILVALHDLSVATSGDYRRFLTFDGRAYGHIIDPRTGWPVEHRLASVTVLHPRCMHADALCTLLTVLGPDAGWDFARNADIAAYFVRPTLHGVEERISPALERMLA